MSGEERDRALDSLLKAPYTRTTWMPVHPLANDDRPEAESAVAQVNKQRYQHFRSVTDAASVDGDAASSHHSPVTADSYRVSSTGNIGEGSGMPGARGQAWIPKKSDSHIIQHDNPKQTA